MNKVCIAYTPAFPSEMKNLKIDNFESLQNTYYRMIIVAFITLRKYNEKLELEFVTTNIPADYYKALLEKYNINIKIVPFHFKPPQGFSETYGFSFYLLDAICANKDQNVLYLDPDVVCLENLNNLFELAQGKFGVLSCEYSKEMDINGITLLQAESIGNRLKKITTKYVHFGGEIYFIPKEKSISVCESILSNFNKNLEYFENGHDYLTTEEHLLSVIFNGEKTFELDTYIRRIWTRYRYNNVNGLEKKLTLWHLPAEKKFGFQELFYYFLKNEEWIHDSSHEEFRLILSKHLLKGNHNLRKIWRMLRS